MKRLTLEELDARAQKQREDFLAKQEAAERAKLVKAGVQKIAQLLGYLDRQGLELDGTPAGNIDVRWNGELVGTLYEAESDEMDAEPSK